MRHRLLLPVAAMLAAALGLAAPATAQNNGHLDGQWLNAQLKAKLTLTSYGGTFDFATLTQKVKLDIGRERCYVALHWRGENSFTYDAASVCQDAAGVWAVIGDCRLFEVADGTVLSRSCRLPFLAAGDRIAGPGARELGADALLRFDAKLNKDGEARSVKFSGSKRVTAFRSDYTQGGGPNALGTFGAGDGKLKLKSVNPDNVPAGAHAAFQTWIAGD